MGHKPKTRCYARIDGVKRQLFEVRERTDKTLVLISSLPPYYFDRQDDHFEFKEQHYSIHRSKDGRDTCITQQTLLVQGEPLSNVCYIHNTAKYLLWPVYARRLPIMDTRTFHTRQKDRAIRVADFASAVSSLYYSIFVAKNDFSMDGIFTGEFGVKTIPFTEYVLVVFTSYQNFPSLQIGDAVGFRTSSEVVGGVKSADHRQDYYESIPSDLIMYYHTDLMRRLVNRLHERLAKGIQDSGRLSVAIQRTSSFTRLPVE